jgi:uncharacterized protein
MKFFFKKPLCLVFVFVSCSCYGMQHERDLSRDLCAVISRNAEGEAATLACIKELVAQGAVVNRPVDNKHNFPIQPLKQAVREGLLDVMEWLLTDGKADPDIQADCHAERPLASAVRRSKKGLAMAQLLLDHKASVDAQDSHGNTALLEAAYNGHTDIVQLLLDRKANPHYRKPWTGETALWAAAYHNRHKVVKMLLDAGAESDIVVVEGGVCGKSSPLEYATERGYHETCELLIAAQAQCDEHKN